MDLWWKFDGVLMVLTASKQITSFNIESFNLKPYGIHGMDSIGNQITVKL